MTETRSSQEETKGYTFDQFKLDISTSTLYYCGEPVALRPKSFDTLFFLVQNRERLVPKQEFMEVLWSDSIVTDDVLVQSIAEIRKALGDDPRHPRYVKTAPRRGYQFIGRATPLVRGAPLASGPGLKAKPVRLPAAAFRGFGWGRLFVQRSKWITGGAILAIGLLATLALLRPKGAVTGPEAGAAGGSVVVLPFEVQSDTAGYDWLSRGLADMIGTGLWHSPHLRVVSQRKVSMTWEGNSATLTDPAATLQVARKLGAHHLVTGSVIKLGEGFQINAHLVRTIDGAEEVGLGVRAPTQEAIFEAVDEITFRLLRALLLIEDPNWKGRRISEVTTRSLDAYRHYIAALEKTLQWGEAAAFEAEREFREALRIDPSFAMAYLKLAELKQWALSWGYSNETPKEALEKAYHFSTDLPEKERLLIQGMKTLLIEQQPEQALATWKRLQMLYPEYAVEAGVPVSIVGIFMQRGELDRAIEFGEPFLNSPDLKSEDQARLDSQLAHAYRRKGDLEKAVRFAERAVSLWPAKDTPAFNFHLINLGRNYLDAGRRENALQIFRDAYNSRSSDARELTNLAWGFYMAGDVEMAYGITEEALAKDPRYGNAHHLKGWIALSKERFNEAAGELVQAFELTPPLFGAVYDELVHGDLAALYFAGVAYQKGGNPSRADSTFRRLIDICRTSRSKVSSPPEDSLPLIQTYILEALSQARLGNLTTSRHLVRQLSFRTDRFVGLYKQMARLFALLGDEETALDWLDRSFQAGGREYQHIRDHPDFESLRALTRFQEMTGNSHKKATVSN